MAQRNFASLPISFLSAMAMVAPSGVTACVLPLPEDRVVGCAVAVCRRLHTILALFVLASVVAGCSDPERAATRDELSAVRDGKVAAVLVRFVGTNRSGQPVSLFPSGHWTNGLALALGTSETGGKPTLSTLPRVSSEVGGPGVSPLRYSARLLSEQSRDEGWLALFLPPGYYYLGVGPPAHCPGPPIGGDCVRETLFGERNYGFFPGDPVWRLEVPAGKPVLYAGTWGGITPSTPFRPQDIRVDDESQLAKEFAARELASLPPPVTRLAAPHFGPYLLGVPTAAADLPQPVTRLAVLHSAPL